jgi:hypothetical protein
MTLRLFGLGKKDKAVPPPAAPTADSDDKEPVEFQEVAGAPAAASARVSDVPSAIGNAKALRATRARRPATPRKAAGKLTPKQLAQRKYAGSMAGVRKRAKKAAHGKGRIAKRSGATKMRRKLGLKAGKKTARKKR